MRGWFYGHNHGEFTSIRQDITAITIGIHPLTKWDAHPSRVIGFQRILSVLLICREHIPSFCRGNCRGNWNPDFNGDVVAYI